MTAHSGSELVLTAFGSLEFPVVVLDPAGLVLVVSTGARSAFPGLRNCRSGESFFARLVETPRDTPTWLAQARVEKTCRLRNRPGEPPTSVTVKAQSQQLLPGETPWWVLTLHQTGSLSRIKYEREILLRISSVPIPEIMKEGRHLAPGGAGENHITNDLLGQIAKFTHAECALFLHHHEGRTLRAIGEFGFSEKGLQATLGEFENPPPGPDHAQGQLPSAAASGFPYAIPSGEISDLFLAALVATLEFPCQEVWIDGVGGFGVGISFFRNPPEAGARQFSTEAMVRLGRHLESATYSNNMYEAFLELRRTQEQMIQSSKMAAIGELSTGMAHELRQPVTVINNFFSTIFDLLEAGQFEKVRERLGEYRERAQRNLARLLGIIDHLRIFGRQGSVDFHPTALAGFLEDLFHTFLEAQLRKSGITATLNVMEGLPPVELDIPRIEQVILNLVFNARDAVENTPKPFIAIVAEGTGEMVRISVTDNGTGIPPEIANRVMEPFFTTKPVGKGTGIGLSISHGIVESHHGTLQVRNLPEGGVRSTVTIPTRQPDRPAQAEGG